MTQENKDRLLRLLQQYKEQGIAEQIDFDKSMTDSLISNSVALRILSFVEVQETTNLLGSLASEGFLLQGFDYSPD